MIDWRRPTFNISAKAIALALLCFISPTPALSDDADPGAKRIPLPPEQVSNQSHSVLLNTAGPIVDKRGAPPAPRLLKLDASYNESISLRDALQLALANNLPIRIANQNALYQRYQLYASLSGFIPSYGLQYSSNQAHVQPSTSATSALFTSQVKFPVFQGGAVLYNALAQYYRARAWNYASQGTIQSKLLEVFNGYNNLCLQEAMLQIGRKSVQLSEQVLNANLKMYKDGQGTEYGIAQARSQLYSDREVLAQLEGSRRRAAIALAFALNLPLSADLIPNDQRLRASPIVKKNVQADECVEQALDHRPELRQYEMFRLAAARSIQGAAASLYPQASFFSAYTHAHDTVDPRINGRLLNGEAAGQVATAQENQGGVVNNTALNQTASVSPDSNNTGTEGANTYASVVAGGGGTPIANVQGGSLVTSGAVAPIFGASGVTGRASASNVNGANTASAGVFPGTSSNFQNGFSLSWTLSNMGIANFGNIMSARSLTKQALLQANQELQLVITQVRSAFVQVVWAEKKMDSTAMTVQASGEAFKYSVVRMKTGIGEPLEVYSAQRDYTAALAAQAQAIANYNQAQAQLLYSTGLISVDALSNSE